MGKGNKSNQSDEKKSQLDRKRKSPQQKRENGETVKSQKKVGK